MKPAADADRRAVAFLLLTVTLDAMGIGFADPGNTEADPLADRRRPHARSGVWRVAHGQFAVFQLVAGPILGSLSDHYGRRPVLLLSLAAFGLSYLLMAFAPTIAWLFVAQALAGCSVRRRRPQARTSPIFHARRTAPDASD